MKTNFIKTGIAVLLLAVLFTACEKNSTESAMPNAATGESSLRSKLTSQVMQTLGKAMQDYKNQNQMRGAEFIPAFFNGEGFFQFKDLVFDTVNFVIISGEVAGFFTDLDGDDFYRLNPDSTVSVHVSSSAATGFYENFSSLETYEGLACSMSANYTGPVITITFPDGFTLYLINIGVTNAFSFHGSGYVMNSTGTVKTLVSKWVGTPNGRQTSSFRLN